MTISQDGQYKRYDKSDVPAGLTRLSKADTIVGHNIIGYDIPVIKKLYPLWACPGEVRDTLCWARLAFPDVKDLDWNLYHKGRMPSFLVGRHSLEAWGFRLGVLKDLYGKKQNAWSMWTPELSAYCEQDVKVTVALLKRLEDCQIDERAIELEHQVAWIINRQENQGFLFDREKAIQLQATLMLRRNALLKQLQTVFEPFYQAGEEKTPKRTQRRSVPGHYWKEVITKDCAYTKIELTEFNPASRQQIGQMLKKRYNWEPEVFTERSGEPKIDDEILAALPYPEAKLLSEYMMLEKRLGQLSDGEEAWMKYVNSRSGRIHGRINPCGAVSGRMTHFKPNLAQVPASYSPYGKECRELFCVPPGSKLVGIDASSLEACCLAHFLYKWDEGAYAHAVTQGRKEDGTDFHTLNANALGVDRDTAKTWFYAYIYGAGFAKLARILGCSIQEAKKKVNKFLRTMPAFAKLKDAIEETLKKRGGFLRGLDGRPLKSRSAHSALNLLCQHAGAAIMKKALVLLDESLQAQGLRPGSDYEFVANVHDEWQIECREQYADLIGQTGVQSITKAGQLMGFKCPLSGDYKVGDNWKETH